MNKFEIVKVLLLDQPLTIKCPAENVSDLKKSAEYLNAQMQKVHKSGKTLGHDRIAMMAGLNVCHELLQLKEQVKKNTQALNQLSQQVEESIAELTSSHHHLID